MINAFLFILPQNTLFHSILDDISSDSDESDNEPISKKKKDASGSEDEVKEEPASDSD